MNFKMTRMTQTNLFGIRTIKFFREDMMANSRDSLTLNARFFSKFSSMFFIIGFFIFPFLFTANVIPIRFILTPTGAILFRITKIGSWFEFVATNRTFNHNSILQGLIE